MFNCGVCEDDNGPCYSCGGGTYGELDREVIEYLKDIDSSTKIKIETITENLHPTIKQKKF